jgi:hypothetical protein
MREELGAPRGDITSAPNFSLQTTLHSAVLRDSNYYSAGLGSLLYGLGADPTGNTVSVIIYKKNTLMFAYIFLMWKNVCQVVAQN